MTIGDMKHVTHEKECKPCDGTGFVTMKNGGFTVEIDCAGCAGYGTVCLEHGDPLCEDCFV